MKSRALWVLLVVSTATTVLFPSPSLMAQPRAARRALIVAIGQYPAESGYPPINTIRDVDLVAAALVAQGFVARDIRVLRDREATRTAIVDTLRAMTREAMPGDVVVFHFSGHGHRISDDGQDELDGLDEVLVPYGAPARLRDPNYSGALHLRDDELGDVLKGIQAKVGASGSVTVFLDACYSGSGTRGGDVAASRGLSEPLRLRSRPPARAGGSDEGSGGADFAKQSEESGGVASLAPLVVFSASRHDQPALETYDDMHRPVGSLSMALSRALPRITPGATNRALFDEINATMTGMRLGEQRPQVEGALDAEVFSGHLVRQEPFHRVAAVVDDSTVEVAAGAVLGLLPGTIIDFFPAGTTERPASGSLGTGRVVEAAAGRATAVVPGAARLTTAWVFVTQYAFADLRLRVQLDSSLGRPTVQRVRTWLAPSARLELVEGSPDVRVRRGRGTAASVGDVIVADATTATVVARVAGDDSVVARGLEVALHRLARTNLLRRLDLASPRLAVRVEVLPTEPRLTWRGDAPSCPATGPRLRLQAERASEGLSLSPRDEFTFRLSNAGPDTAYVTVLELLPDGRANQVYPLPDVHASDNRLPPGRTFVVPDACYFAEEPLGPVVYKLFASLERIDFSGVLTGNTRSAAGTSTPLSELLDEARPLTRGSVRPPTSDISTHAVTIQVVPSRPRAGRRP